MNFNPRELKYFTNFLLANCLFLVLMVLIMSSYQYAHASHIGNINVVDRHGQYVGRILPQKKYWVPINHIPVFLQQALIAVEDSRFYSHDGIDIFGIARAMFKNIINGKCVEGGSTITQQLIKNKYLNGKVSFNRKAKEAKMAIDFEKSHTKQRILEMYFNEIYYGNGVTGIAQAARLYFNKRPSELTKIECVLLAGIPKNPNRYNPMSKPSDILRRRDIVLERMVALNMITEYQRSNLRKQSIAVQQKGKAVGYLAQLRNELIENLGSEVVDRGGLDVTSSLDLKLQKYAERILHDEVKKLDSGLQGSLLCIDNSTGDILAAVGGIDRDNINRVFFSRRQPGSTLKPLIYAAAINKGITASSVWDDLPVAYNNGNGIVWKPENFNNEHYGHVSFRRALSCSNNVISVKLLNCIGIPYFVDFAQKLGLTLNCRHGLSLALGTEELTLNKLVEAYTPLANNGLRSELRMVLKVYDHRYGKHIEYAPRNIQVMSSATAFITTKILQDVIYSGTAKTLRNFGDKYHSAGKTGTTDNCFDAWFVGYTPQVLTGIWIGYDKPRSMGYGYTGGNKVAPIWEKFMLKVMSSRSNVDFIQPQNILSLKIDAITGQLATTSCRDKHMEYYIIGTEPLTRCVTHNSIN